MMLLKLLGYDLNVDYHPGKEMYIADVLSRAFVDQGDSDISEESEAMDIHVHSIITNLPVSEEKKVQLRDAVESDPEM